MPMPIRLLWAALACAVAAALLGFATAPHYRAPAADADSRLLDRAAEFYRAQRRFDPWTLVRMYTPARQSAEGLSLAQFAASRARVRNDFDESTIKGLEQSTESISPEKLTVQRVGNWAVTTGTCTVFPDGTPVPLELDKVVWVYNGADWWVYQMTLDELNAYGNPPDFARQLFKTREFKPDILPTPGAGGAPASPPAPKPEGGAGGGA
jgi:hypothetical protein